MYVHTYNASFLVKRIRSIAIYWLIYFLHPLENKKIFFLYFLCQVNFDIDGMPPYVMIKMCVYLFTFTYSNLHTYIQIYTYNLSELLQKQNYLFTFNLNVLKRKNKISDKLNEVRFSINYWTVELTAKNEDKTCICSYNTSTVSLWMSTYKFSFCRTLQDLKLLK